MWIFTKHGFISAVCALKRDGSVDTRRMVVRARHGVHLLELLYQMGLPEFINKIKYTPRRDYAYRVVLTKRQFVSLVSRAAARVDYPNFKSACHRLHANDYRYQQLLRTIWQAGYDMQVAHQADQEHDS